MKVVMIPGEAEGAIPNGTRIIKNAIEVGDGHKVGALGTVLASHGPLGFKNREGVERTDYGYFIEWDDTPGVPVFVCGYKIERLYLLS